MCTPGSHKNCGSSVLSVLLLFHESSGEAITSDHNADDSRTCTSVVLKPRLFAGDVGSVLAGLPRVASKAT